MSSAANATKQAIASAFERFNNETELKGDFPWSEEWVARLVDDNTNFDELKESLRSTEAVEERLRRMLVSVSDASQKLREKFIVRANRSGFRNLPDEILAMILELALGETRSPWDVSALANSYSLVSRRFRRVVLAIPAFWSKISSPPFKPEKAAHFASRVTTPTICLSIKGIRGSEDNEFYDDEEMRVIGMFILTMSISSRIRKLALHFSVDDLHLVGEIQPIYTHLSLPSLSELKLDYRDMGHSFASFCREWVMPSLQTLTLKDAIPQFPSAVLSQIKTCSIEANRDNDGAFWSTSEILEFITSLTSVEDLRVAVRLVGLYNGSYEPYIMKSVRNFNLGLQNDDVARHPNVLLYIAFPSMVSLRVELGLKDFSLLHSALNHIYFRIPPTSVTSVTVAVGMELEDANQDLPVHTVGEWCTQFGDIKSLKLESNRDNAHNFFSFANSIDAVEVVDERGSVFDVRTVENVPFEGALVHSRQKAIFDSKNGVSIVDEYISDTDSDVDF
ncbi:hypothetical protein SCHPADRAFT_930671 [Schizopora paradoxa]|uniref:Uncharacterized protein n=1 Tax=Schizopora paradoxa TaxID=27342 RepID=A0A0H2REB3_9AGAM|nr:hypothetical protein SCHPADRAFT_930671 [Schizopora paradoxa]